MKKILWADPEGFFLLVACFIALIVFYSDHNDKMAIARGEIIITTPDNGIFENQVVRIDKMSRTVTSATMQRTILWEDNSHLVHAKRSYIQYRVHMVTDTPARDEELAFYRSYFP